MASGKKNNQERFGNILVFKPVTVSYENPTVGNQPRIEDYLDRYMNDRYTKNMKRHRLLDTELRGATPDSTLAYLLYGPEKVLVDKPKNVFADSDLESYVIFLFPEDTLESRNKQPIELVGAPLIISRTGTCGPREKILRNASQTIENTIKDYIFKHNIFANVAVVGESVIVKTDYANSKKGHNAVEFLAVQMYYHPKYNCRDPIKVPDN
ncbi:hypothetical protein ACFL0W_06720 [Nanoarchaeota archaeon]